MAVYTEVSDEDLESFVAAYDIGSVVACKGIAEGVENSNYLLQTDTANYILTLYEKRVDRRDLPFFIGLMDHLASHGLACPTPVHGLDGVALRELCGRPACLVTFLKGMSPRRVALPHCGPLGAAMAQMHLAGADFPMARRNSLSVGDWRPLLEASAARADEIRPGLADLLDTELHLLEDRWPSDLPTGVIHADLFPDNVFFLKNQVSGLIDFYFACTDAFAYDIAICLNAWCFESDGAFNATKARHMLNAYRRVRPITPAELEALPLLARGSAMRFLLTRLYDWLNTPPGAFVRRKDPLEYLHKLRFHQGISGPGAYGLE